MARTSTVVRAALLALLGSIPAGAARAQHPAAEPPPMGEEFDLSDLVPSVPPAGGAPAESAGRQRVGPYGVSAHSPDPLFSPEPYRLERPGAAVSWYAAFDIGLVKPHVKNRITSGEPIGPAFTDPVQLPVAPLDWTVSPRFELGYRLTDGRGDLRFGYRFLATSGVERRAGDVLKSRLDFNVFDFDYVSSEWLTENPFGPFRDLRFVMGVRLATSYLDSVASGGPVLDGRFSSHFVGAGPRFGLQWSKSLPSEPLELYARFDAAGLIGQTRQNFGTSVRDDAGLVTAAARCGMGQSNGAIVVNTEVGLAWRPTWSGRSRVVIGYQFDQWWNLGRTDDSNFDLSVQGIFFRAEWRY